VRLVGLIVCVLAGGCSSTLALSLTPVDEHTYDGYTEELAGGGRTPAATRAVEHIHRLAQKKCRGKAIMFGEPTFEDGFGGYGAIGGEAPTVRVHMRVRCE